MTGARAILYCMEKEGKNMTCRMASTTTTVYRYAPGMLKEARLGFQRNIKTLQAKILCTRKFDTELWSDR